MLGFVAAIASAVPNNMPAVAIPGVAAVVLAIVSIPAFWLARRRARAAEDALARSSACGIAHRRQENIRWLSFLAQQRTRSSGMSLEDALVQAAVAMQLSGAPFSSHRCDDLGALFPDADPTRVDRALSMLDEAERALTGSPLTTPEQNLALLADRCPGLSRASYERLLELEYFNRR